MWTILPRQVKYAGTPIQTMMSAGRVHLRFLSTSQFRPAADADGHALGGPSESGSVRRSTEGPTIGKTENSKAKIT